MYISFYLDDIFHSGLVTSRYNGSEFYFYADLTGEEPFKLYLGEPYYFVTDTSGKTELANAIGKEILLRDHLPPEEVIILRRYQSEAPGAENQLTIKNGEMIRPETW